MVTTYPPQGSKWVARCAAFRVLDMSALGPGPFCSMLLARLGAEVISVSAPCRPR